MSNHPYFVELAKRLSVTEIPEFRDGASGYFSKPRKNLDPALFDAAYDMHPAVRAHILTTLYQFWTKRGYREPGTWATTWLAGSGASYQWAGDRGHGDGDLDILVGIDWDTFYLTNPLWSGVGLNQIIDRMDDELRHLLWPRTAHTKFGGRTYEVTYFANKNSSDIRDINPYAAYNVTDDVWTVRPNPATAYDADPGDAQWYANVTRDLEAAVIIRARVTKILGDLQYLDGAYWTNAMTMLATEVNYAVGLMNEIHGNRHKAFEKPLGNGYWDFNNWRWQADKRNGVVGVLAAIERAHRDAEEASQTVVHGGVLATADDLTIRAAMQYRNVR
ncbi:hypothetical protein ACIOHC_35725 [Streptomyces sp. NPDC088252]|uniref:hypothetical protein n=1 Tax=Streptomyces sp. NPDC088252 TaxID=3365845 RepID=UPI0038121A7A